MAGLTCPGSKRHAVEDLWSHDIFSQNASITLSVRDSPYAQKMQMVRKTNFNPDIFSLRGLPKTSTLTSFSQHTLTFRKISKQTQVTPPPETHRWKRSGSLPDSAHLCLFILRGVVQLKQHPQTRVPSSFPPIIVSWPCHLSRHIRQPDIYSHTVSTILTKVN
jgi:hypothetical protein